MDLNAYGVKPIIGRIILLVGGDKGGADQRRFYKRLIAVADERFDEHMASIAVKKGKERKHGKKS